MKVPVAPSPPRGSRRDVAPSPGAVPPAAGRPRAMVSAGLALRGGTAALEQVLDLRVADAAEIREALDADPPDVVLLDGQLPARELRAILERAGHPDRPDRPAVIVVTEEGRRTHVEAGLIDHADDFVNGALGADVLLARLRTALRTRACLAELARKNSELEGLYARLEGMAGRMAEELRLASHLQRTLLPPPLQHARLDVAAEFIPAREIGGDYYDVIPLDGGRLVLAIGDVMGKGVPAALLASYLKASLRAHVQGEDADPAATIARVNQLFWEVTPKGLFATLFFGVFDFEAGVLEYVNSGHPPALVLREDQPPAELSDGGTVLGLAEQSGYVSGRLPMRRGDVLVLFSDGLTDRSSPSGELLGPERLREAAVRARGDSARIALYSVLGEVQGWSGGRPAEDDQTLIVARLR